MPSACAGCKCAPCSSSLWGNCEANAPALLLQQFDLRAGRRRGSFLFAHEAIDLLDENEDGKRHDQKLENRIEELAIGDHHGAAILGCLQGGEMVALQRQEEIRKIDTT